MSMWPCNGAHVPHSQSQYFPAVCMNFFLVVSSDAFMNFQFCAGETCIGFLNIEWISKTDACIPHERTIKFHVFDVIPSWTQAPRSCWMTMEGPCRGRNHHVSHTNGSKTWYLSFLFVDARLKLRAYKEPCLRCEQECLSLHLASIQADYFCSFIEKKHRTAHISFGVDTNETGPRQICNKDAQRQGFFGSENRLLYDR